MSLKLEAQNKLHEIGYVIYRVLLDRSQRRCLILWGIKTIREGSENMFLYKNKTRSTNRVSVILIILIKSKGFIIYLKRILKYFFFVKK